LIFFSKKYHLIDQFADGLVDIHNHLLPGLDDGAATIEDTAEMIRLMKSCNIVEAIATPHTMEDFYDLTPSKIEKAFHQSNEALKNKNLQGFLTHYASEYMIDHQFLELMKTKQFLYLKDQMLLTEFSYFQKPASILETVFKLTVSGIQPILAHPERYRYMNDLSEFIELKEKGFLFQLNLLSITGYYGKDALKKSKLLLENQLYDFIGTDAHRASHLQRIKEANLPKKIMNLLAPVILNHNSCFN
jgi:protein-tyrosine phosphatase